MNEQHDGTVYIYVLSESDTGIARYVGITRNPKVRLQQHLARSTNPRMKRWVQDARARRNIDMKIVEVVPAQEDWRPAERTWIKRYATDGTLLNRIHNDNPAPVEQDDVFIDEFLDLETGARVLQVVLSTGMMGALDRASESTGMNRANVVRAALVEWIDKHPAWTRRAEEGVGTDG